MKKYLFDKIQIESDGVKFIPFRKASLTESFLAFTQGTFNQEEWEFIPLNLNDFLKMLSKTKLNHDNEYNAIADFPTGKESVSFDELIKDYAYKVFRDKAVDEKTLSEFYTKAYQIRKEAQENKRILNKDPSEFVKE